jgi:hypothetical protein
MFLWLKCITVSKGTRSSAERLANEAPNYGQISPSIAVLLGALWRFMAF